MKLETGMIVYHDLMNNKSKNNLLPSPVENEKVNSKHSSRAFSRLFDFDIRTHLVQTNSPEFFSFVLGLTVFIELDLL